jgi:SAM-dependent methyltransferase
MPLPTPDPENFKYTGAELDVFSLAENWKAYVRSQIKEFLNGTILEVGSGIGSMTKALYHEQVSRWVALDPDLKHTSKLKQLIREWNFLNAEARTGTLKKINPEEKFDAILYMDVLEHIEEDRVEMKEAAQRLKAGGYLIVLAPAHAWLFSPFDRQIGHFRRYTRETLRQIEPENLEILRGRYLDCVGMAASSANRLFLHQATPSAKQILFWDRVMIPCSRKIDGLFNYHFGKSILMIWKKRN